MGTVAVIAHNKKSFGGGLPELRSLLTDAGIPAPIWCEITKSRKAPRALQKCLKKGADLIIAWGGDGTVQQCIDALVTAGAGKKVKLAILPAGTANLLACNLGIPQDLAKALDIALHGPHRRLDVGVINGEHFAVMAGMGFDALMIGDADRALKDRIGRIAYIWTGLKNLQNEATRARVSLNGTPWFEGRASCVLLGNVSSVLGGIKAFPQADPHDGMTEIGVVQAESGWQWLRVLARTAVGDAARSPLVSTGRACEIRIKLSRALPYQLDGGARKPTSRFRVRTKPGAITVCVPAEPTPT